MLRDSPDPKHSKKQLLFPVNQTIRLHPSPPSLFSPPNRRKQPLEGISEQTLRLRLEAIAGVQTRGNPRIAGVQTIQTSPCAPRPSLASPVLRGLHRGLLPIFRSSVTSGLIPMRNLRSPIIRFTHPPTVQEA